MARVGQNSKTGERRLRRKGGQLGVGWVLD